MDKEITELVKRVIRDELGEIVSKEIEIRFEPFLRIAKENRDGIDELKEQVRLDRQDIDKHGISLAKIEKQGSVIINNQDHQEDRVVEAVEKATDNITPTIEKKVEEMFDSRPFLKRLLAKFRK